jgi:hypothetical protein
MPTCESYLDIAAPTQRIWDFLADFSNWSRLICMRRALGPDLNFDFRLAEGSVAGENAVVLVSRDPGSGMLRQDGRNRSQAWTIVEWVPQRTIALGTRQKGWLTGYSAAVAFTLEPKTQLLTQVGFANDVNAQGGLARLTHSLLWSQGKVEKEAQRILLRLKESVLA